MAKIPHNAPTPLIGTPELLPEDGKLPFSRRDAKKSDFFPDLKNTSRYFGVQAIVHKACGGSLYYDQYATGGGTHKCTKCWNALTGGGFWKMTTIQRFSEQDVAIRFWAVDK